jgi:suppressor of ftsI/bilirubin oxidase
VILDASLRQRYGNPLRLPGQGGWMTPLRIDKISTLTASAASLVLRGKRPTPLWAYHAKSHQGQIVYNPILMARPGDEVALYLKNKLPQPTTIHWHGLTNDTANDGAHMNNMAAPGKQIEYAWKVRNGAGLNWYHPHPHGCAGQQLWRGLSSFLIVEDDASDRLAKMLGVQFGQTDIPLIIQDRTIERTGDMPYADSTMQRVANRMDPVTRLSFESLCQSGADGRLFHGVHGEDILVNLTRYPVVQLPRRWVRFRLLNASNARVYRLAFQQNNRQLPFALLGVDGGLLPVPQEIEETFFAPGQRLDVAIDLRRADLGDVWLKTLRFDPMHNDARSVSRAQAEAAMPAEHVHGAKGEGASEPILRIEVKASSASEGTLPSTINSDLAALRASSHLENPVRDFSLDFNANGQWMINGQSFDDKKNAFSVQRGSQEIWELRNAHAGMPHPMHLHGFSFQVLGRNNSPKQLTPLIVDSEGRLTQDLAPAVDTVLVWPGETVRLGIDFTLPSAFNSTQQYMFHCHNLEHGDLGMMLQYGVV